MLAQKDYDAKLTVARRLGLDVNEAKYPMYGCYLNFPTTTLIGTGTPRQVYNMLMHQVDKGKLANDDTVNYVYAVKPRKSKRMEVIDVLNIMINTAEEISHGRALHKEHCTS